MVVVSGSWVKNVATYPTPPAGNDMVIPTDKMSAKAVLICRPNSHPFQERTLCLNQPVKVGRSVARARATVTNAIFDCKVLSRHHALLWYENGKFYLQDTKSSNGTFVNNNRLSTSESDPHEVSSGDIVQFGVDVVENNRKVTHGCIVATLKLYLPDGKEAKASPSITEGSRHGFVPLDELYKLNQIIQEAAQREQCLENKLVVLQSIVQETKKLAEESWQVYVGEERLLSRVAALESQLDKVGKSCGDDRLREELNKLQEDRIAYQIAAKESLRKLHSERMEAVVTASEQEQAKITAEQEAMIAKDLLMQAQQELQDVAQKLTEEHQKADKERAQLEQRERELQVRLESETEAVNALQSKLEQLKVITGNTGRELLPLEELEKCSLIYTDDLRMKEDLLAENNNCENEEVNANRTNGIVQPTQNHINLTVAPPVAVKAEIIDFGSDSINSEDLDDLSDVENSDYSKLSSVTLIREHTVVQDDVIEKREEGGLRWRCSDKISEGAGDPKEYLQEHIKSESPELDYEKYELREEKERNVDCDQVDTKTLKYHFQSVQNELKKQIEQLEEKATAGHIKILELESDLEHEKKVSVAKVEETENIKEELRLICQKWKESCSEGQQLRDKVACLQEQLVNVPEKTTEKARCLSNDRSTADTNTSYTSTSTDQIAALEEELVFLKERFAQVNDEKVVLNRKCSSITDEYNKLRNRSHNTTFLYIAPMIFLVLYIIITYILS